MTGVLLMDPATCDHGTTFWYSEKEKKLLGVSYEGHKGTTRHFFGRESGELFGRMERHLRGYELGNVGSDKAEGQIHRLRRQRPHGGRPTTMSPPTR